MKWTRKKEPSKYKGKPVEILIHHSDCGRYHVGKMPDKGYQYRESSPGHTFPIMIKPFDRLVDAKQFAIEQEENRLKIWHYFVEYGTKDKEQADAWVANPTPTCGYMEGVFAANAAKSLEEIIESHYMYVKYRSHLAVDPKSYAWTRMVDPAMVREWQERLDGTFVQYWKRESA